MHELSLSLAPLTGADGGGGGGDRCPSTDYAANDHNSTAIV